ncbi:MAG: methyltransferase domain-containing protein, partial [Pseudonocardiaceae bacterium]
MSLLDPKDVQQRLVVRLIEEGALVSQWRPAFEVVHRAAFIPDTVWVEGGAGLLVPLHRTEDPDHWQELAHADDAVITQVDDGHPAPDGTGRRISSSASMPTVVAQMLAYCRVQPGHRVLEIGTGTGYNAALLAYLLGAENVVTIEVDSTLAEAARHALHTEGFDAVTVVTGDGGQGYPAGAPFDRVLSTAAVQNVPYPWVEQTRSGGLIITPWGTEYYNGGLLVLTVNDDGTAIGHLAGKVSFMTLREQRFDHPGLTLTAHDDAQATVTETDIHPAEVANGEVAFDACIAIALRVPSCDLSYALPELDENGEGILWL